MGASGAPPVPGGQEKSGLDGANISFMLYSHCQFDILNIEGHKLVARGKDIHPLPSSPRPAR